MLRNITKIVQSQKAKFATAAAAKPNPNPEILYTGVSLFILIMEQTQEYKILIVK